MRAVEKPVEPFRRLPIDCLRRSFLAPVVRPKTVVEAPVGDRGDEASDLVVLLDRSHPLPPHKLGDHLLDDVAPIVLEVRWGLGILAMALDLAGMFKLEGFMSQNEQEKSFLHKRL